MRKTRKDYNEERLCMFASKHTIKQLEEYILIACKQVNKNKSKHNKRFIENKIHTIQLPDVGVSVEEFEIWLEPYYPYVKKQVIEIFSKTKRSFQENEDINKPKEEIIAQLKQELDESKQIVKNLKELVSNNSIVFVTKAIAKSTLKLKKLPKLGEVKLANDSVYVGQNSEGFFTMEVK